MDDPEGVRLGNRVRGGGYAGAVSEQCWRNVVSAGMVTQLLLLVQSASMEKVKRKAQLLLKLLRGSWPEDLIRKSYDFAHS